MVDEKPTGYAASEAVPGFHYWVWRELRWVMVRLGFVGFFTQGKHRALGVVYGRGTFHTNEVSYLVDPDEIIWPAEDHLGALIPEPTAAPVAVAAPPDPEIKCVMPLSPGRGFWRQSITAAQLSEETIEELARRIEDEATIHRRYGRLHGRV